MCLLCGCRLNGALNNGDSLLRLNAEKCFEEHNQSEREGRRYKQTLKLILKIALDNGIIKPIIDLSAYPTFMIYWGKRMIQRWGTVFSTMYNRALPGLFPLTCFDLNSGLFLWMDDFIGKVSKGQKREDKEPWKGSRDEGAEMRRFSPAAQNRNQGQEPHRRRRDDLKASPERV